MGYEPKDGDGKLFKNTRKEKDAQPDMTGSLLLGGVTYRLVAWRKEGRDGNAPWLSIRCEPERERTQAAPPREAPRYVEDEDLPF